VLHYIRKRRIVCCKNYDRPGQHLMEQFTFLRSRLAFVG